MFRVLSKVTKYQNPWIAVSEEEAEHEITGTQIRYSVVRYLNPSVVVIVQNGTKVLVEEIERYPVAGLSLEIPAGGMESGETPEQAAIREVLEETGITIRNVKCVYQYYPSNGSSDQSVYIVVGEYCAGDIAVQTDELKNAYWMEADALRGRIADNTVKDGLSIIAALLFLPGRARGDV